MANFSSDLTASSSATTLQLWRKNPLVMSNWNGFVRSVTPEIPAAAAPAKAVAPRMQCQPFGEPVSPRVLVHKEARIRNALADLLADVGAAEVFEALDQAIDRPQAKLDAADQIEAGKAVEE